MSIHIPKLGRNIPTHKFIEVAIRDCTSNEGKRTCQGNLEKEKKKPLDIVLNTNVKKTNALYPLETESLL